MKTKNSLERLYSTAYPKVDDERCKSIFKIGSLEHLFLEIKKIKSTFGFTKFKFRKVNS
jgi:hypothetical protein